MLSARRSRRGFCAPCKCAPVGPTRDRILAFGTPTSYDLEAYREGLKEAGYVEGQNLAIEYRFANDDPFRLSELASDLVRSRVRVIVAVASGLAVRAAQGCNQRNPDRFRLWSRSRKAGFGRKPQSTGRQYYGRYLVRRGALRQATWNHA